MSEGCPFCGSTDIVYGVKSHGMRVLCRSCFAEGPPVRGDIRGSTSLETTHMRRDEAFRLWNLRFSEPPKAPKEAQRNE